MITRLFQIMAIVVFSAASIGTVHAESDRCGKLKKAAQFTNDYSAYDAECKGKKKIRKRTSVKTEIPVMMAAPEPSGPKMGGILIAIFFLSLILAGLLLLAYDRTVVKKLKENNARIAKRLNDLEKRNKIFVTKTKEEFEKRPINPPTTP